MLSPENEVWVEEHPLCEIMPEDMKRWRVMYEDEQHSVHPSIEEANSAADELRARIRGGWNEAQASERDTGQAYKDWKR